MPTRILVVDDEPAVRQVVKRALAEDGHDVVDVADGPTALSAALGGKFDLVVTNNRMPGLSGPELIAHL